MDRVLRKDLLEPAECLVDRCLWGNTVGHIAPAATKPVETRTERWVKRPVSVSFAEGAARPSTRAL
jgi:hypothetical protein